MASAAIAIWLMIGLAALVLVLLAVALVTDGRDGGKWLVRWCYDRLGPSIFGARSEADRWRALAALLALRDDARVLDVGTATGDLPRTLAAAPGFRGLAAGVDWSPRLLATARDLAHRDGCAARTAFVVADGRQGLPFASECFDVVICQGVLEGLRRRERERLLGELVRVLAPHGALVVSVYRGWATIGGRVSRGWYERQLAPRGLGRLQRHALRRSQDVLIARRPGSATTTVRYCADDAQGTGGEERQR